MPDAAPAVDPPLRIVADSPGGWFWCQNFIFEDPAFSSFDRLVFLCLCYHADAAEDVCWPSLTRLAQETGISRSSVIRALDRLEGLGRVARFHQETARGEPVANTYKVYRRAPRRLPDPSQVVRSPRDDTTPDDRASSSVPETLRSVRGTLEQDSWEQDSEIIDRGDPRSDHRPPSPNGVGGQGGPARPVAVPPAVEAPPVPPAAAMSCTAEPMPLGEGEQLGFDGAPLAGGKGKAKRPARAPRGLPVGPKTYVVGGRLPDDIPESDRPVWDCFIAWYREYPRDAHYRDAFEAWKRRIGRDPERIALVTESLAVWKRSVHWVVNGFIKEAQGFLSGEFYLRDPGPLISDPGALAASTPVGQRNQARMAAQSRIEAEGGGNEYARLMAEVDRLAIEAARSRP